MLTTALIGFATMLLGIAIILIEKRVKSLEEDITDYKIENLIRVAKEVNISFEKMFDRVAKKKLNEKEVTLTDNLISKKVAKKTRQK